MEDFNRTELINMLVMIIRDFREDRDREEESSNDAS